MTTAPKREDPGAQEAPLPGRHQPVGTWRGVTIEVAVWDGVLADVALSCAGMFTHEMAGAPLQGGLAHLDAAFGGAITRLRAEGHFEGREGEFLLIDRPPAGIAATRMLMVGLGEPEAWSPETMRRAVVTAFRCGVQQRVPSLAFAPGMLDSGLHSPDLAEAPRAMLNGLIAAIDAQARLAALGLAEPLSITRWAFDVGAARFDGLVAQMPGWLAERTRD